MPYRVFRGLKVQVKASHLNRQIYRKPSIMQRPTKSNKKIFFTSVISIVTLGVTSCFLFPPDGLSGKVFYGVTKNGSSISIKFLPDNRVLFRVDNRVSNDGFIIHERENYGLASKFIQINHTEGDPTVYALVNDKRLIYCYNPAKLCPTSVELANADNFILKRQN